MEQSILWAALWGVAANVIALLPSRDNHWSYAYILIALGVPILIGVAVQNGVWVALIALIAAMSVLRWPVIYLTRWLRRALGG